MTDIHAKIAELMAENELLKQKLKSYTQPRRNKLYYETHRDEYIARVKQYKASLSPEKKREYAQRAYAKRKEKLQKLKVEGEGEGEETDAPPVITSCA